MIALAGLLVYVKTAGRLYANYKSSGTVMGAIFGTVFGSANITPAGNIPKGASQLVKLLLILVLPAGLLVGCAGTQVVTVSKGTGLDADIPIGYNGANLFELKLKIGQFINTTAVQATSTNKLYAPGVSVASTTDGSVNAPTLTGATSSNSAAVTGGEKYLVNLGSGNASVTNAGGSASSTANP